MLKEDIINKIRESRLPVIISGAGIVGEVVFSLCENAGIEVDCFCDSSEKTAGTKFCDKEVIYTPDLKQRYDDAVIIISVAAIKDVVDLLEGMGYSDWHAGGLMLKDIDIVQYEALIDYKKYAIENCILCHDGYLNPDKLFFRSIDLIITERCSLKCKNCSNLMQYYEEPRNCDTGMLMRSIDAFCAVVDEVMDFRVIGGDAFMNKEWPVIVSRLTGEPKAKRVVLYTNGTLVPKAEDISCLRHEKVIIIITDYGLLSRKLDELKKVLEENGITYYVLKVTEWLDCAAITPHNRGIEGNMEIYRVCCAKNMPTLSDGKLFRCPYAANASRLSAVPDYEDDYIDLLREPIDAENIESTKSRVRDYILHKDYMKTCDFCNGRPLSGPEVKPALQADRPLEYHKYDKEQS